MWSKGIVFWMCLESAAASSDEVRKLRISNNKLSHDNQVLIPILEQTIQKQNAELENYATLLHQERAGRTEQVGQLEWQLAQKNAELEAAILRIDNLNENRVVNQASFTALNPCAVPYQSLEETSVSYPTFDTDETSLSNPIHANFQQDPASMGYCSYPRGDIAESEQVPIPVAQPAQVTLPGSPSYKHIGIRKRGRRGNESGNRGIVKWEGEWGKPSFRMITTDDSDPNGPAVIYPVAQQSIGSDGILKQV